MFHSLMEVKLVTHAPCFETGSTQSPFEFRNSLHNPVYISPDLKNEPYRRADGVRRSQRRRAEIELHRADDQIY